MKRILIIIVIMAVMIFGNSIPPIHAELQYETVYTSSSGLRGYLIVVDADIYGPIFNSLKQYYQDLEAEDYKITTIKLMDGSAAELKDFFKQISDLEGVLLIGGVPIPQYELENDHDYLGYAKFPCDLFYMDLDGTWLDEDGNGIYDYHDIEPGQDFGSEIWVARLTASTLTAANMDEVGLINNYFAKVHDYRTQQSAINHRALAYKDDDWATSWTEWLDEIYSDVTVIYDYAINTAEDYKMRLRENYEWIHLMAHSSPTAHYFGIGGVSYSDIINIQPLTLFYNLFACSNARFTSSNYMAGHYMFAETNGLAAVGTTKAGGMQHSYHLYTIMGPGQRKTIGEAFHNWFSQTALGSNYFKSWSYGMTLLGDPTLSIDPPRSRINDIHQSENLTMFDGAGDILMGNITAYSWRSNIDGYLGDQASFSTTLSPGIHKIYFKVKDDTGRWSAEDEQIYDTSGNPPPPVTIQSVEGASIYDSTVDDPHISFTVTFKKNSTPNDAKVRLTWYVKKEQNGQISYSRFKQGVFDVDLDQFDANNEWQKTYTAPYPQGASAHCVMRIETGVYGEPVWDDSHTDDRFTGDVINDYYFTIHPGGGV